MMYGSNGGWYRASSTFDSVSYIRGEVRGELKWIIWCLGVGWEISVKDGYSMSEVNSGTHIYAFRRGKPCINDTSCKKKKAKKTKKQGGNWGGGVCMLGGRRGESAKNRLQQHCYESSVLQSFLSWEYIQFILPLLSLSVFHTSCFLVTEVWDTL